MKKIAIATALLIGLSLSSFAQQKKQIQKPTIAPIDSTFKVELSQQYANTLYQNLTFVFQKLHQLKVDALLRDTLDQKINTSGQILQYSFRQAFVADSLKKAKLKPKP